MHHLPASREANQVVAAHLRTRCLQEATACVAATRRVPLAVPHHHHHHHRHYAHAHQQASPPPQNNRAPSRRQPCSADRSVAPYLASFGGSLGGIGCSASLPDQSTSLSILAVTKHFLAAHPLPSPNNIPILPWKADFVFFPPHHHLRHCCDCVAATKCPTTLAASRCRCRHSASSYRERPDPHAHRLRQATASTSRRNRNAHTRARFHRRLHHHHGHRRCVLMSTDPKAQAVWQTPRHRHQAASLATQR